MERIFENIILGINQLLELTDWTFVAIFILTTYLIFSNKKDGLSLFNKKIVIKKSIIIFIYGILLSVVYSFIFLTDNTNIDKIKYLTNSIIISMVIYKFGISDIIEYVKNKFFIRKDV